jgi:tripartite ATP-independent transporter DctP family solute receptor
MKKNTFYVIISSLLLIVLASCSNAEANDKEVKIMRLANATPDERSLSQALYKFGDIIEEETNGSIQVEVYTNTVLGGDREVFERMQFNIIQGATISTGPIAQFSSDFNIFDLPFLFPDKESAFEILDGPIGQELLGELEEQNIVGLNYWENGYRQLTNNKKEIKRLEDVAGLDIRTLENKLHMNIWKQLGANPTAISYGELYLAMEQGIVDGQENPAGNVLNSKFYEVQKYITKTNHIYNASPLMVSKPFWDSLTSDEQKVIRAAAEKMKDEQRKQNQTESDESYKLLEEQGMIVTELSDEERLRFREAVEPIYDQYRKVYGNEVLDKVQAAIEKGE